MIGSSDRPSKGLPRMTWALAVIVPLLCAVLAVTWLGKPAESTAAGVAPPQAVAELEALQSGFTWMAETIKPSVVLIQIEQEVSQGGGEQRQGPEQEIPRQWRDLLPEMPEMPEPQPGIPMGQGSGVIIDPSGYVLTNNHVVANASRITVYLTNGESYSAEVVGTDKLTDLAVVKIDAGRPLVAAQLGDADQTTVGSWAMAVGYPFGARRYGGRFDEPLRYEPTVTVGVVSATNRAIESDIPGFWFRNLLQTDAPINRGNSGGPLINARAEVIGINQAIFTSTPWGGNIGVGFATPINADTKVIIDTLKSGDAVVRGRVGVLVAPLTDTLKSVYRAETGVFVEEVQPDTPASRGGLQAEDVITTYDGRTVTSQDEFVNWVQGTPPGTTVEIQALRDDRPVTVEVTIEALALEETARAPREPERERLGLTVEELPKDEAGETGVEGGVRVLSVDTLGDGARAGLRRGDVVLKINREPVSDVESYRRVVGRLSAGDPVAIRVLRSGHVSTFQIDRLSE